MDIRRTREKVKRDLRTWTETYIKTLNYVRENRK